MIQLKSKQDIYYIKQTIEIGEFALTEIKKYLLPGITTLMLDLLLNKIITNLGAKCSFYNYKNFPGHACISINKEIIHGVPSNRKLQNGDVVKIDIGINYNGYFSDQARTYIVGTTKNQKYYESLEACKKALKIASFLAEQKYNLKDVSESIEKIAKSYGLGILKDYCGHGVGFEPHEKPLVPNCAPYIDLELKSGMVLAIEPMFVLGKGTYNISHNKWTIIADGIGFHEEKTIIIE